ncbi:MAG: metallopeptidase family protein [Bryobacteraceae bacterium]|nr:metallopeptidase family protein [Bryobacteraceae bacterium]
MPFRVSTEQFDRLAEEALASIAPRFRKRLTNVVVAVEEDSLGGELLGLHETGLPHGLPDRITIYQRPHELEATSLESLRRLVEETVIHEVGHYFGLNEREVLRMERRIAANRSGSVHRRTRVPRR